MRRQTFGLVNVLPGEQEEVLLDHAVDIALGERAADGAAMLVPDMAGGLV